MNFTTMIKLTLKAFTDKFLNCLINEMKKLINEWISTQRFNKEKMKKLTNLLKFEITYDEIVKKAVVKTWKIFTTKSLWKKVFFNKKKQRNHFNTSILKKLRRNAIIDNKRKKKFSIKSIRNHWNHKIEN